MINTVGKIELGLAAAAIVLAIGVAAAESDPGGFVLLFGIGIAVALCGLALAGSGFTDRAPHFASPAEAPPLQMVSVGRVRAPKPSPWPLAGAVSLGLVGTGVAIGHTLVLVGLACGVIAAAGWLSQAWREDPAFSPREGARISQRFLSPVGLPLIAVSLIAVIVISVSRILLALPKNGSIVVAFLLSVMLLITFFALSSRPHLGRNSLAFLGAFAVVAVVSAGSLSAASGYRTFERHESGPGPVGVVAHNTAFNEKTITVVAGESATIDFKNLDPVYHNIAVYSTDPANPQPFWNGEPIKGVKTITYTHTFTMAPGTYTFRCDFHPTSMVGIFVVQAAPATGSRAAGTAGAAAAGAPGAGAR